MLGTDELFEYIEKYHIELDPRFNDILGRLVKQKNISFIVFFFNFCYIRTDIPKKDGNVLLIVKINI